MYKLITENESDVESYTWGIAGIIILSLSVYFEGINAYFDSLILLLSGGGGVTSFPAKKLAANIFGERMPAHNVYLHTDWPHV
jgi:hypothetical protein